MSPRIFAIRWGQVIQVLVFGSKCTLDLADELQPRATAGCPICSFHDSVHVGKRDQSQRAWKLTLTLIVPFPLLTKCRLPSAFHVNTNQQNQADNKISTDGKNSEPVVTDEDPGDSAIGERSED